MQDPRIQAELLALFDGDATKAAHWLATPKRALGGGAPIVHMATESDALEVLALIQKLQQGVAI